MESILKGSLKSTSLPVLMVVSVYGCLLISLCLDARRLRNKMIESFEEACLPGTSDEDKAKLLHFVVVGGGPTARKTARQMAGKHNPIYFIIYWLDFLKERIRLVPQLEPYGKVTLVNYLDHIHNYYDHSISDCMEHQLYL